MMELIAIDYFITGMLKPLQAEKVSCLKGGKRKDFPSASLTTNLHFCLAGARLSARRNVAVSLEPTRSLAKIVSTLAMSGLRLSFSVPVRN